MNRTYVRGKQKFQCPYCTSKFSQKHNLKMHVKQKHDENFETTDFRNISRISNDSEILAKKQNIKDNLEVSEHQNTEGEIHSFKKSKVSFSNHWKTLLNGKLFQCQMCRFTVKKKSEILLHINEEHFESFSFGNDENSLKKSHNTDKTIEKSDEIVDEFDKIKTPIDNEKDGNKKLFMCNLCEYSFGNIKELLRHLSTLHEGNEEKETDNESITEEKKETNDDSKVESPSLSSKKKISNTSTRFQCSYCDSNYAQKTNLYTHVKQNHEENFNDWKLASNLESSTGVRSCDSLPLEDVLQF